MLRTIVVPLEGTDFAAHPLPVGIALATPTSASIRLIGIAATDGELAWTYGHVSDHAKGVGLDPADVEVRVDPSPSRSSSTWRPTTTTCCASRRTIACRRKRR